MTILRDVYISVVSNKNKKNFLTIESEEYSEEAKDIYSIVHIDELTDSFMIDLGISPENYIYVPWGQAHLAPDFINPQNVLSITQDSCLYEAKFTRKGTKRSLRRTIAVPNNCSIDKVIDIGHHLYPNVEIHSMEKFSFKNLFSPD